MSGLADSLSWSLDAGVVPVLITVKATLGSTPREAGARMLVWSDRSAGTIGGGRLELEAIAAARRLIAGDDDCRDMSLSLGPSIGQCCGGHVTLRLERADRAVLENLAALETAERAACPAVLLFGAGHVGKAIAAALAPLPLTLSWIDSRAEEFPGSVPRGVERIVAADPVGRVASAPPGAAFLILTHSHAVDFALAEAVLRRGDAIYCGLIGSATKRRRFERWYVARGGDPADVSRLVCPIGAGLDRDKRPAVIAAMVAAEVLIAIDAADSRLMPSCKPAPAHGIGAVRLRVKQ
jgi:xanthine dehydrogenase accessory protein XdhC